MMSLEITSKRGLQQKRERLAELTCTEFLMGQHPTSFFPSVDNTISHRARYTHLLIFTYVVAHKYFILFY